MHLYIMHEESLSLSIKTENFLSGKFRTPLLTLHVCREKILAALNNLLIFFLIMVKCWFLTSILKLGFLISQYLWLHLVPFKSPRNFVKVVVVQKGKHQARFISCSQIFPALKLMKRRFIRMRSIQPEHTGIQSSKHVLICLCLQ